MSGLRNMDIGRDDNKSEASNLSPMSRRSDGLGQIRSRTFNYTQSMKGAFNHKTHRQYDSVAESLYRI